MNLLKTEMKDMKNYLVFMLFILFPLSFFSPKLISVFCIFAFLINIYQFGVPPFVRGRDILELTNVPFILFFLFLILIFSSILWSVYPRYTLIACLKIVFIFSVGLCWIYPTSLQKEQEEVFALFKGMLGLVGLIYINNFSGHILEKLIETNTPKHFTPLALSLSILIWPYLLLQIKKKQNNIKILLLVLYILGSLLYTECDTAIVNIILGVMISSLVYIFNKKIKYILISLFSLGFLASPFISTLIFQPKYFNAINKISSNTSYLERTRIYYNISSYILERPLLGFGLHNSRFLPHEEKNYTMSYSTKNGEVFSVELSTIPLHPHNFFLEIWVELGIFGVGLGCALFSLILTYIFKIKDKLERAISCGYLISILSTMTFSLSMWQTWWLCFIFLSCGILIRILKYSI